MVASGSSKFGSSGPVSVLTSAAGRYGASGSMQLSTGVAGMLGSGSIGLATGSVAAFEKLHRGDSVDYFDVSRPVQAGSIGLEAGNSIAPTGAEIRIRAGNTLVHRYQGAANAAHGGSVRMKAGTSFATSGSTRLVRGGNVEIGGGDAGGVHTSSWLASNGNSGPIGGNLVLQGGGIANGYGQGGNASLLSGFGRGGSSGSVLVESAPSSSMVSTAKAAVATGQIVIRTGSAMQHGATGAISMHTGNSARGRAGNIQISAGASSGSSSGAHVQISAGSSGPASKSPGGNVIILAGTGSRHSTSGSVSIATRSESESRDGIKQATASGQVSLVSGSASGPGTNSGDVLLASGSSLDSRAGTVSISAGFSPGNEDGSSGKLVLRSGGVEQQTGQSTTIGHRVGGSLSIETGPVNMI